MVEPTEFDREYLTPGQIDALKCPVCGGMLVRPVSPGSKGLVCPTSGHTGLIQEMEVQERFVAASPKALSMYDPRRVEYQWNYAARRCGEHWQDPAALKAALALLKKRKGKKP